MERLKIALLRRSRLLAACTKDTKRRFHPRKFLRRQAASLGVGAYLDPAGRKHAHHASDTDLECTGRWVRKSHPGKGEVRGNEASMGSAAPGAAMGIKLPSAPRIRRAIISRNRVLLQNVLPES